MPVLRRLLWLALSLSTLWFAGCAAVPRAREPNLPSGLDTEALLLLMSDGLLFEPLGVQQIFHARYESHEQLALALGRIGDPRGVPLLEGLLVDPRAEVRRSAAFALGVLGDAKAVPALLGAALDPDAETGRLAIASLARLGQSPGRLLRSLDPPSLSEMRRRLLPTLFRFDGVEVDAWIERFSPRDGLERRWTVYAASRSGGRDGLALLREGVGDSDPQVRSWSARGLGRLGEAQDLERLRALLEDREVGPIIQALRGGGHLAASGRAAADRRWLPALRRLLNDPRPAVRTAALEVAGYWLLDSDLERDLELRVEDRSGRESELALEALALGGASGAEQLTLVAAMSGEPSMRASAARSAGLLHLLDVLHLLRSDNEPRVRLAALTAQLVAEETEAARRARRALADPDPAIRAAALEKLAESPVAPLDEILAAFGGPSSRRHPELLIHGVRALRARSAEPLERGAVIAALEELARHPEYLVRRESADALQQLGRPRPSIGWIETGIGLGGYREVARRTSRERLVSMRTSRGTMLLSIACPQAPLTCESFMKLVSLGFYDGLTFHRVVPDFVVQTGDPRGDGWGGPGYTLRDEVNRIPFERGVVGMARAGRHTGGSQFFMTLSRQPHLDGEYTAFGRVVDGEAVLDEILEGDRVEVMRELEAAAGVDSGR